MRNDDKASHRGGPIIAVAVVAILLASYVGAYFGLSEFNQLSMVNFRTFKSHWQAKAFGPALMIEEKVRGKPLSYDVEGSEWLMLVK